MAVTSIWKVKDSLDRVIQYTTNEMKTDRNFIQDPYDDLSRTLTYAGNPDKTERQYFVSGINCDIKVACEQMKMIKQVWHKEHGILAYHGYQSFKPGEVTPEVAHKIGVKLAQELWGDRFQVTVSTHLDKGHLHNHFVINSISYLDGKRYYNNKQSYARMRKVSDRLCKEYELSVIEHPKAKTIHYAEWIAGQEKRPTIRNMIKIDVDEAIAQSLTYTQFIQHLRTMDYEIKTSGKYVAIRATGRERYIRLKSLGSDYTEMRIKERILENKPFARKHVLKETKQKKIYIHGNLKSCRKITGIKALYFRYLYALGIIPKRKNQQNPIQYLREDILKLDQIIEEARFIGKHDFTTVSQLLEYKDKQDERLSFCLSKRRNLYNRKRKHDCETIKLELTGLNKEIQQLRKEVVLSARILKRSQVIKPKLAWIKQEQTKQAESEVKEHELRNRSGRSSC